MHDVVDRTSGIAEGEQGFEASKAFKRRGSMMSESTQLESRRLRESKRISKWTGENRVCVGCG